MKVYLAQYNPCVYESSYGTVSIHTTKEGAERVIKKMKAEKLVEWTGLGYETIPDYEQWQVREMEVIE